MDFFSTSDLARQWGVTPRYVQRLLHDGRIPGARKCGGTWLVPTDAEKPSDPRVSPEPSSPEQPSSPHRLPRRCPILSLTTLYSRPGSADATLTSLEGDPSAHALFDAHLSHLRGDHDRATALSQELLAQSDCFDTRLGCHLNLANVSIHTGDYATWQKSRLAIKQTLCLNEDERAVREFCLAVVDSGIYDRRSYPKWLKCGHLDRLPTDCFPAARFLFAKYFVINRANLATISMLEPLCAQSRVEGAVVAELYLHLTVAIGYHNAADSDLAAPHLDRALELALPDRLYVPLAETRWNVGMMLDDRLRAADTSAFRAVTALSERLIPNWTAIFQRHMRRVMADDLTVRESEVARYAARGMTNEQIATTMGLSVNTIRSFMSVALRKTGLSNRNELTAYFSMG